jgi:hypothetical protein
MAAAEMTSKGTGQSEEADVEVFAELVASLRQMVNNPQFSDMVFLVAMGSR